MMSFLLQLLASLTACGAIGLVLRRGVQNMDIRRHERRSR